MRRSDPHSTLTSALAGGQPVRTTLLSLLDRLYDELGPQIDAALVAADLIGSGRVVLTGNFRGQRHFELG